MINLTRLVSIMVLWAACIPVTAQSLGEAGQVVDSELVTISASIEELVLKVAALEAGGAVAPEVAAILIRLDAIDQALADIALADVELLARFNLVEVIAENFDLDYEELADEIDDLEMDYGVRILNAEKKLAHYYFRISMVELRTDETAVTTACWNSGGTPNLGGDPVCICVAGSTWTPAVIAAESSCRWDNENTSIQPATPDLPLKIPEPADGAEEQLPPPVP